MEHLHAVRLKDIKSEIERLSEHFEIERSLATLEIDMPLFDEDSSSSDNNIIFLKINADYEILRKFVEEEFKNKEYYKQQLESLLIRFRDKIEIQDMEDKMRDDLNAN